LSPGSGRSAEWNPDTWQVVQTFVKAFTPALVLALVLPACAAAATTSTSSGDASGPAITVDQLVARSSDTPIVVQGLLISHDGVVRLCAAVLESFPPQCGGESVELTGLDPASVPGVTTEQGVTWKEGAVVQVQRTQDGRFAVLAVAP
jgi:hypothetical protein